MSKRGDLIHPPFHYHILIISLIILVSIGPFLSILHHVRIQTFSCTRRITHICFSINNYLKPSMNSCHLFKFRLPCHIIIIIIFFTINIGLTFACYNIPYAIFIKSIYSTKCPTKTWIQHLIIY